MSQVNVQYNTVSNWVNLAKGGHSCQFCGRTYPWKAALDKHIEKQHKVEILIFGIVDNDCVRMFKSISEVQTFLDHPPSCLHAHVLVLLEIFYQLSIPISQYFYNTTQGVQEIYEIFISWS